MNKFRLWTSQTHISNQIGRHYWRYGVAVLVVSLATAIEFLLLHLFGIESPFLIMLAAVIVSALYGGMAAGVLATILSAFIGDRFFLFPTYTFIDKPAEQNLYLIVFIIEGLLISGTISSLKTTQRQLKLEKAALQESEERNRLMLDAVQDYAIFMLDPDGYVVNWNKGAQRLKGYRSNEIIGQHFSRFYLEEDVERGLLETALQAAATEGRVETEGWQIRKNGSRFWANVVLTALTDEAGNLKGFSNATRDLTAIKRHEAERDRLIAELQLERSRLETILAQMPVGIVIAEAATGKIIFGNQEMEKICRHPLIPAENIDQYRQYKSFHPDGRPYQPQETVLARTITRSEAIKNEEISILRGDGTYGTILANSTPLYDVEGKIEAGIIAFLDISDRKQAQEQITNVNTVLEQLVQERTTQLEQARNNAQLTLSRLNGIIEGTSDLIAALDLEFRFTAFNTAYKQEFTKVFGCEPEIGMCILDPIAHLPEEQAKVAEVWGKALQGDNYTIIEDFGDPDLERNYYEINFNSIKDENDRLIGASQIVRNVSDRILTESQIRQLNQELEQRVIERTQALQTEIQERIKIESDLRESEEKFRATFDRAGVGIAHVNIDGRFQIFNQKLCNILGYSATEISNLSIADITYPEDLEADLENVRRMLDNEIQSYSMEKRYIRQDGSLFWGNLTVSLVREANGEPKYLIGVVEDITDRKQFAETLQAKNREITNILDSITDGFVSFDRDWRYTYVNQKAEEILGKPKDRLLGNIVWEVFPEAVDLPGYFYCHQAVNEQVTIQYEESNHFLDKWLDVRLYPTAGGLALYFQDITDRKKAEIKLKLSEAKFRRLADANVVGIIVAKFTGEIIEANEAFLQMLGFTRSDLDAGAVNWRNISPPEYLPQDAQKWQELQQTGKVSFEKEYLHKNGNLVPVLIAAAKLEGNEDAAICMIVDLTERKQAELALRQSEQHFRNLADSMPQIVWTANADGTVDYYNQRVHEFSGFTRKQDGTWQWEPVLHEDDRQRTLEAWLHAIEIGEIYECEHRIKRIDGELRWHLSRGMPVKDDRGRIVKWYGTATDIHAQKQYQAEREELLQREQLARTEAESASQLKDEFLATLSHELRTPMTAMLGWTSLLRTSNLDEATANRALETIDRNTKTLNRLIEDILDVSRIIRGKLRLNLQPIQLMPAIEEAIETVKPTAEAKDIQIIVEPLQTTLLQVMGDSSRWQQIIWNLLSNAIKFTPNGGCVTVRVLEERERETERDENNQFPMAKFAEIQVIDTGIGIAPEFLPFVFDRFRQADGSIVRSHGGLGLGLSIVRSLVELHGGTVRVHSLGEGQGATFTVRIPLLVEKQIDFSTREAFSADSIEQMESISPIVQSASHSPQGRVCFVAPESPESLDSTPLKGLQVLIVDDELDTRDLLSLMLEDYGANVVAVASAKEALETVPKFQPDAIVSDIGMPESDGYSLVQQLRTLPAEAGGKIPAIALTAYASNEDRRQAICAGFQLHLAKPVNPTELVEAIAQIVSS